LCDIQPGNGAGYSHNPGACTGHIKRNCRWMGRRGIVSGRRKSSRSVRTSTPARFCMLRSRRLLNASGAETGTQPPVIWLRTI